MDKVDEHLTDIERYARYVNEELGRRAEICATTDLEMALEEADYVVAAIEVDRYLYWSQDFHIPRRYGFRQVYGENGGPGGLFHALHNMGPTIESARAMEQVCPDAPLLNYTNPEHKLCEAVTRLTGVQAIGLCHGVFMGQKQIARILELPEEELETAACGINHFTWFQKVRERKTGEDLYPRLREMERKGDWLSNWHESGWRAFCFDGSGSGLRRQLTTSASTSAGPRSSWPATCSTSTTRWTESPRRRARSRSSCTRSAETRRPGRGGDGTRTKTAGGCAATGFGRAGGADHGGAELRPAAGIWLRSTLPTEERCPICRTKWWSKFRLWWMDRGYTGARWSPCPRPSRPAATGQHPQASGGGVLRALEGEVAPGNFAGSNGRFLPPGGRPSWRRCCGCRENWYQSSSDHRSRQRVCCILDILAR